MLTIDYANCLAGRVGTHGVEESLLEPGGEAAAECTRITADLETTRGTGWERWRLLPFDPMRSEHVGGVRALVERSRGRFDNVVVLGIGGSALGAIAVHAALNAPNWNLMGDGERGGPRLFVLDNVDPTLVGSTLEFVAQHGGLARALVVVVSKSGETAETAAQFLIARRLLIDALGANHADNLVAVTDPAKGTLRTLCDEAGYATLPVPDGVGGRFSVLSPVGLLPLALVGVDIEALLAGAAAMDDRCRKENLLENPAALLATLLVRLGRDHGKHTHVLMPYSNALYLLADWFRQLWAESLGKAENLEGALVHTGFTPVKALGATDQHSQVQLYREGPNDKVIGLIGTDKHARDVAIPTGGGVAALEYLEGSSLSKLLAAEQRATEYALVESERPNFTIHMPRIDAAHIGEFIQLWQVATACAGRMLEVDAYNQPAVETGKRATFGLMGKAGFEEHLKQVNETLSETKWRV
jgi:glucose-6-phosphate isomerase